MIAGRSWARSSRHRPVRARHWSPARGAPSHPRETIFGSLTLQRVNTAANAAPSSGGACWARRAESAGLVAAAGFVGDPVTGTAIATDICGSDGPALLVLSATSGGSASGLAANSTPATATQATAAPAPTTRH